MLVDGKLGDAATLHRGYDLPEASRTQGPIPVISSSGISGWHDTAKLHGENVITGRYGTIGEVFYHNGPCWPLNTALYVSDFRGNDPRYIAYLLEASLKADGKDKSTVPGVDRNVLHELPVRYYNDAHEQQVVVQPLMDIDDTIKANRAINDNLQSTLQALYGYWFMQFNYPDANGRPYKSSGGRMSYNEKLGCSIPEGWDVASIVNNPLTDVITPGVDLFTTKTYHATADVNGMDIGTGSPVNYETRESRANMQPRLHTVWFAKMKNSVKHLFLGHSMEQVIEESILSTGFMGLQCKEAAFEYISAFIDGPYFERAKDQYANGATQQAVGNAELESVYLVVPDDETLARFHELTRGLVESIGKTIIENKRLVELRDWLLPMLMNGQATVEATQPNATQPNYRLPYD